MGLMGGRTGSNARSRQKVKERMAWDAQSSKSSFHTLTYNEGLPVEYDSLTNRKIPTAEAEMSPPTEPQWMSVYAVQQIQPKG